MAIRPEPDAHTHKRGTKTEMIALLRELAEGWDHLGRKDRAKTALDAIDGLEAGSFAVRVGATTYSVVTEP